MRDLASHISVASALDVATYSADSTPVAVDLQGFDSAVLHLAIGVGGITCTSSNKIDFVLTHSDDGTTYAAVTADDLIGNDAPTSVTDGIVKSLTAAHAAAAVYEIGYIGGKRYLELVPTFSGTHATGTPLACNLVKGTPWLAPAA
jgi:hypothetical protein